jgi:hypothetical protein
MTAFLNKNFGISSESQTSAAQGSGALGKFATTNKDVLAAEGEQAGDPAAVQAATVALAGKAKAAAGNYADASGSLMQLSDAIDGGSGAAGKLIAAAAAWSRQLQSFQMPTMNRNQQLGTSLNNMQSSAFAARLPGASDATQNQAKSDRGAYEQQKEGYRQYLISVYQQAQQYSTQMQRADEDQHKQVFRNQRDFQIQMLQGQQDYERSTLRGKQDFTRQLVRQAESTAQTIYSPFQRVQAQYTLDAGTLVSNLQDQNLRIAEQYAQLGKLRKAGVSQNAIDTLQLSDPSNAQQLNNIVGSIANDPSLVSQINKAVGTRVSATTKLTQSNFTMSFRNTVSDFNLSLNRASADYGTAHDRAVKAQHRALSDMGTDYNQMVRRSGADLKTSMTELYGDFGKIFGGTMNMVTKNLAKYAPEAAAMIAKQLETLRSKYPGLFDPSFDGVAGPMGENPRGVGGARGDIQTGPDTRPNPTRAKPHAKLSADGVIATSAQERIFGEAGPEAAIPLSGRRGHEFLLGMYQAVSKSVVQQMHTSPYPAMPRGQSSTSITYDQSTLVTGNSFELKGDTAAAVLKELKAKDRLGKLTSPSRR